jgi:hypothetical protein
VGSAAAPELKRIADRLPKPEPLHDRLGGKMDVAQDSFSWESLRLRFQSSRFDVALLGPWLHKWLDPGEDRSGDAEGLSGVVHGLSWDRKSSAWDLHIDLGSAPIEALEELMGVIADAGTVSVHVSSGDAADATSP